MEVYVQTMVLLKKIRLGMCPAYMSETAKRVSHLYSHSTRQKVTFMFGRQILLVLQYSQVEQMNIIN